MTIYENVKKICDSKSIPIGVLETDLGISHGYISKWWKHTPNIKMVKQIADYLGVTVNDLINDGSD